MKKTIILTLLVLAAALTLSGCLDKLPFLPGYEKAPAAQVQTVQTDEIIEQTSVDNLQEETEEVKETEPSPEVIEISQSDLVGTWASMRRGQTTLFSDYLALNADGTVQRYGNELYHAKYEPFGNETGWYTAPMGFPADYGTYKLNGNVLEITFTAADFGEYDEPYTETLVISSFKDGKMVVNNDYGTYINIKDNMGIDTFALCDLLGVDYSAN